MPQDEYRGPGQFLLFDPAAIGQGLIEVEGRIDEIDKILGGALQPVFKRDPTGEVIEVDP